MEALYETLIASDFVAEGRAAAEWLAERTGGQSNIVELQGTAGSDCARERQEGFAEVLAQHDGMTVIAGWPSPSVWASSTMRASYINS